MGNNFIKKIKNNKKETFLTIFLLLMQFVLLKPSTMGNYPILNLICNVIASLFTVVLTYDYVKNYKKYPFSSICLAYFLVLFISTLINKGSIIFYLKTYTTIWGIILYSEILIHKNRQRFMKNLALFIEIMLIINILSLIIFGNYNMWGIRMSFLGFDNAVLPFLILGNLIITAICYLKYKKFTKEVYFMTGITFITGMLVDSSNAKFITILMILFYILWITKIMNKEMFSKIFNFRNFFILSLFFFFIIVVFRMQYLFKDIIVNILHRSLTFTGRTKIWDTTIEYIKRAPILGYGIEDFDIRLLTKGIFHAHSTYLNILLEGGIIALIFYLNIFYQVWRKIKNRISDKFVIILSYGMFLYMIMTIIEYYKQPHMFYILLLLLYYSDYLGKKYKRTKKDKILVVTSGYLPMPAVDGGAVESLTENILKYNENSNDYKFVCYSVTSKNLDINELNKWHNTEFRYINKDKIKYLFFKVMSKFTRKKLPDYFIYSLIEDLNERNEEYETILIENMPIYAMYMKKYYGGKIILHVHNDWLNKNTLYAKEIVDSCEKIITASNFVATRVLEINSNSKTKAILNGIETDRFKKINDKEKIKQIKNKFGISDNDSVILFTGKLKPEKGALQVVEAFNKVNKNIKNIKLLMVGSSFNKGSKETPYTNQIKNIVSDNKNIIFTGFIDYKVLHEVYSISDIQVVPSIIDESCPLVILEGLSSGLALIVTNSGGIPELVDNNCSFMYERNKDLVKNIEISMEKMLTDNLLLEKMKKSSLKKSEEFTNEKFCKKILAELNI